MTSGRVIPKPVSGLFAVMNAEAKLKSVSKSSISNFVGNNKQKLELLMAPRQTQ